MKYVLSPLLGRTHRDCILCMKYRGHNPRCPMPRIHVLFPSMSCLTIFMRHGVFVHTNMYITTLYVCMYTTQWNIRTNMHIHVHILSTHKAHMFTLHTPHVCGYIKINYSFNQSLNHYLNNLKIHTHLDQCARTYIYIIQILHRHKLFTWHSVCVVFSAKNFTRRYVH